MMLRTGSVLMALLLLASCSESMPPAEVEPEAEPAEVAVAQAPEDPDAQLAEMARDCEDAAAEIAVRQAESTLYDRLGGREQIEAIMLEMVDVHMTNPDIKPLFDGVDMDGFIKNSTDFLAAGAGGEVEYTGRDIPAVHERMNLNSSLFLAAGADLETAMQNLGVGPNEQQEVMCALVSLRGLVLPADATDSNG